MPLSRQVLAVDDPSALALPLPLIKRHLDIDAVDGDRDAELLDLSRQVADALAGEEGLARPYFRQTLREATIVGPEAGEIRPSCWPVEAVHSIRFGDFGVTGDVRGFRRDQIAIPSAYKAGGLVTVEYTAGWLAPDAVAEWAPGSIVAAGAWVESGQRSDLKFYQATIGGVTGAIAPAWPDAEAAVEDGGVTWIAHLVAELPHDIQRAAIVAAKVWELPVGIKREGVGSLSQVFDTSALSQDLPPASRALLRSWR